MFQYARKYISRKNLPITQDTVDSFLSEKANVSTKNKVASHLSSLFRKHWRGFGKIKVHKSNVPTVELEFMTPEDMARVVVGLEYILDLVLI